MNPERPFAADNVIFISKWYRDRLRITDDQLCSRITLKIDLSGKLPAFLWPAIACIQHPQVAVRLATWLGLVGLGLGFIGVGLGLLPLGDLACVLASLIHCIGWCIRPWPLGWPRSRGLRRPPMLTREAANASYRLPIPGAIVRAVLKSPDEVLERATGIEPVSEAWEASVLPLY
jgi:hypothetical protein